MKDFISMTKFVETWVDKLPAHARFQARQISHAYSKYVMETTRRERGRAVYRLPYSDSIQRRLRERRATRNDVNYYDKSKSIWWKADHEATIEDRKIWR